MRSVLQSSAFYLAVMYKNESYSVSQASFGGSLRFGKALNSARSTKVNNYADVLPILRLWIGLHGTTNNTNYFLCSVYLHGCTVSKPLRHAGRGVTCAY